VSASCTNNNNKKLIIYIYINIIKFSVNKQRDTFVSIRTLRSLVRTKEDLQAEKMLDDISEHDLFRYCEHAFFFFQCMAMILDIIHWAVAEAYRTVGRLVIGF